MKMNFFRFYLDLSFAPFFKRIIDWPTHGNNSKGQFAKQYSVGGLWSRYALHPIAEKFMLHLIVLSTVYSANSYVNLEISL